MNREFFFSTKVLQLKSDFDNWLKQKKQTEDPTRDVDQVRRNAERLIWKMQERYGYVGIRPDREQ